MKKLFSLIVVLAMVASLLIPVEAAGDTRSIVQVSYAEAGTINIDGKINAGEWDENNKIQLSGKANSAYKMQKWAGNKVTEDIDFYYAWNDAGLYMAAKVIDTTFMGNLNTENMVTISDRFQIFLNPGGLINDDFPGLVFSFCPTFPESMTAQANVKVVRHNIHNGIDDDATLADDVVGKMYRHSDNTGWDMEVLLPWKYIATADRNYDIDQENPTVFLNRNFDPNDNDRSRAYLTAMIAYVDVNYVTSGDPPVLATGRTCLDGFTGADWGCATYGLYLKLNLPDQKPTTEIATDVPTPDTDAITEDGTDDAVTGDDTVTEDVTGEATTGDAVVTGESDTAAGTNSADTSDDNKTNEKKDNNAIVWIIVAVAAVAAVAAAVVIVLKKKKK